MERRRESGCKIAAGLSESAVTVYNPQTLLIEAISRIRENGQMGQKKPKRRGYEEVPVTIPELFSSGLTNEPSENALRKRAAGGLLVFMGSVANEYKYDKWLSIIRVNASRKCKRPGVNWSDIETIISHSEYTNSASIKTLDGGCSYQEVEELMAADLRRLLGQ